jgi:AcrR family transcriptional regulator
MEANYPMADESTRAKIIQAGTSEFLSKGYENASLRRIAAEAGVTTGAIYGYFPDKSSLFDALVEEPANHLRDWYISEQRTFETFPAEVKEQQMHQYSSRALEEFVDYIYLHFDAFKLVVCCSAGTAYEGYIESFIDVEIESTRHFIEMLRSLGYHIRHIDDNMIHILASGLYTGIFEIVVHDMPKERALEYIRTLNQFYSAGWDSIFGMEQFRFSPSDVPSSTGASH